MMAEEFQLPPLFHSSHVSNKVLPLPLTNCFTLTKTWHGQCEGAGEILQKTILNEVDTVLEKFPRYDEISLLAALQAMVIYITILLFPKSSSTTWSAGHDLFLKIQRIVYHAVGTGLFLREEREQIRPSWEAWIHVTSKRRAVLSMYLLHWAYAIWQKVPCFDCKEIGFMPAPAAKVLWQAGSEEQWNTLYTRWLARWDGRGYLQGEFDKIRPGNSMDSRAEKWLEETDEFGFIMISIVNATDRGADTFRPVVH